MITEPTIVKYLAGRDNLAVGAFSSVLHALELMDSKNTGALGVIADGHFAGIFTQSDFIKRVLCRGLNTELTSIMDVMTLRPVTVTPDCGIKMAYFTMMQSKISHLPVVDENMVFKGIITEEDLRTDIQDFMDKTSRDFHTLLGYIHGESYGLCANY